MLALMPVVALAAACNGLAPTASTGVSTDLSADGNGAVVADGTRARGIKCEGVAGIQLDVVESKTNVWVDARYVYKGNDTMPTCPAPTWSADVKGLMVDRENPFRAGFARSIGGIAVVTAVSPNGVSGEVKVTISPATGDVNAPATAEANCKNVSGVNLTVQPSGDDSRTAFRAEYQYSVGTTLPGCSVRPAWDASRKGLTIDSRDGFKASIATLSVGGKTVVTATAPTGAKGELVF